jgi:CelD/BcsL family acetyltransferase involved in cellulose biosynthesis
MVWNGKVYFYLCGRRPDLPARIRPGIVLRAHAIALALAAGLREYDFLGGPSRYKSQLSLASRSLVGVRAARPLVLENVRVLGARGAALTRRLRATGRSGLGSLCRLPPRRLAPAGVNES